MVSQMPADYPSSVNLLTMDIVALKHPFLSKWDMRQAASESYNILRRVS